MKRLQGSKGNLAYFKKSLHKLRIRLAKWRQKRVEEMGSRNFGYNPAFLLFMRLQYRESKSRKRSEAGVHCNERRGFSGEGKRTDRGA